MDEDGSKASGTTEYTVDPSQLDNLFDMSAPQQRYRALIEAAPAHRVMDGMVMVTSRAAVDETLRDPARFSSAYGGGIVLGNTRPLIPLSVDPPDHSKYRKILDPLFAPKRMDAIEDDVAARVNHFIDGFADRGGCHFTDELATPFPSAVFLGLMGLPWEELDTFLTMKNGILRPGGNTPDPEERMKIQRDTGQDIYRYFDEILDKRAANPEDDILTHFLTAEVDGDKLDARRDPRHLLPVPHRRPRHRHRLAHLLLRVPRAARRPPAHDRRRPVGDPRRGRGAPALGDAGAGCAAVLHAGHRGRGVPGEDRRFDPGERGCGQRRSRRVPRRLRRPVRPRGEPAHRLRWWRAPLSRVAPRRVASCASRYASGTGGSPSTS